MESCAILSLQSQGRTAVGQSSLFGTPWPQFLFSPLQLTLVYIECEFCNVLILPLCMFRLRAPIHQLITLDNNGNQNVFLREAPLTNASSPTILPGPGKFQEAGMFYFDLCITKLYRHNHRQPCKNSQSGPGDTTCDWHIHTKQNLSSFRF